MFIDKYEVPTSDFTYESVAETTPNNKDNVVIYSGGADSTLLLYELSKLKLGTIHAVSFNPYHILLQEKIKCEKEARKRFKKYCTVNKINNIKFSQMTVDCSGDFPYPCNVDFDGMAQPTVWTGLLSVLLLRNCDIYLGYIKGDDFWMYKSEFFNTFNEFKKLSGSKSRVILPYAYFDKEDILQELNNNNLLDCTWTCELPTKTLQMCGECIPCRKHKKALRELEEQNNKNTAVEKEVYCGE